MMRFILVKDSRCLIKCLSRVVCLVVDGLSSHYATHNGPFLIVKIILNYSMTVDFLVCHHFCVDPMGCTGSNLP
jgi:hypothetical protein